VFKIKVSDQSMRALKEMDVWMAAMIISWLRKKLSKSTDPRKLGGALFKKDNRFWRYKLGDYRLLAIISDDSKLIILIDIKHHDNL
jgi:mRNA interferase RelE/StbE